MVRIIMMKPPSYMPSHMADFDGFYSLDLNKAERIALTRVIDDYADVGTIKQDTFKDLTLPLSKKNKLLLGAVGNPSALNVDHNKVFDIQLLKTDFSYPVQGLQIVGVTDVDGGGFLVTIFGELNDWYRPMNQLKLNELDLGSEVISYAWYKSTLFPNHIWQDANYPVFTTLVNYGRWFIESNISTLAAKSQVVFNDYRFWYSPLAILKAAFCQVGYELISPNLEEEEFRQQWCYLLDPNFETANQADILNRPFDATRTSPNAFGVLFEYRTDGKTVDGVFWWTPTDPNVTITDPGAHLEYHPFGAFAVPGDRIFGSFYRGGVVGDFKFTVSTSLETNANWTPISPNFVTVTVKIMKSKRFGVESQSDMLSQAVTLAEQKIVLQGTFFLFTPRVSNFNIETGFIKVYQHEVVFALLEIDADIRDDSDNLGNESVFYDLSEALDATFSMEAQTQVIEEGDTIDFGLMLRKDISPIDLFRGVAHLNGLKVETDSINKKVYAYPEFRYNWYKSGLQEGFFRENTDNPFNATPKIQTKSMEEEFLTSNLGRNVYLKFLDSTDGFIQKQALTEQELHSKKTDLGAKFPNGDNVIENPFFEPTDIAVENEFSLPGIANVIPFLWENTPTGDDIYPEKGFNYTPRILIAYPYERAQFSPNVTGLGSTAISAYIYEDTTQNAGAADLKYNLFGQIFLDGTEILSLPSSTFPDMANVYGNGRNPLIKDQFTLFYSRIIQQAYFGVVLNFLVKLDLVDFSNISFRRKWKVRYLAPWGEIFFYGRLSRVDDYVIGENITTPVQLISDSNNTNLGC